MRSARPTVRYAGPIRSAGERSPPERHRALTGSSQRIASVITELWDTLFFNPMLNVLLLLYKLLFSNFGLAIIGFTVLVRLVMLPLTLKQLHASKQMSALQPKMADLQKRHANDREGLSKATMELY